MNQFASGSWDSTIKLWSTSLVLEEGAEMQLIQDLSSRKRQKIEKKGFPRVNKGFRFFACLLSFFSINE